MDWIKLHQSQVAPLKDLAWALTSPPLMQPDPELGLAAFLETELFPGRVSQASFSAKMPAVVPATLQRRLSRLSSRRLGHYFEALLLEWIENDPDIEVVASNLPIRSQKTTLGEVDLIARCQRCGALFHREFAIKFYLGYQSDGSWNAWLGPNANDRLDLKLKRMIRHQLPVLHHQEVRELWKPWGAHLESAAWLRGWLFYPHPSLGMRALPPVGTHPDHLKGWWFYPGSFEAWAKQLDLHWVELERLNWLSGAIAGRHTTMSTLECLWLLRNSFRRSQRPVLLSGGSFEVEENGAENSGKKQLGMLETGSVPLGDADHRHHASSKKPHWNECVRVFVVPDHWPAIDDSSRR